MSSFEKQNQWHPWEEIHSCSHSRKPELPVTHSSTFSMWLSILFFPPLLIPRCQVSVMDFVGGGSKVAIPTTPLLLFFWFCSVNILAVYRIYLFNVLPLPEASVSESEDKPWTAVSCSCCLHVSSNVRFSPLSWVTWPLLSLPNIYIYIVSVTHYY